MRENSPLPLPGKGRPPLIFLAISLIFIATAAKARVIERIAAVVNDEVITLSELDREVERMRRLLEGQNPSTFRRQVLERLIDRLLLDQELKAQGIRIGREEVEGAIDNAAAMNHLTRPELLEALKEEGVSWESHYEDFRLELAKIKLVRIVLSERIRVTDEDLRIYYASHYSADESAPREVRVKQVLFPLSADPGEKEIERQEAKARRVLERIREGEDLAQLFRSLSEKGDGTLVSDLGWVRVGGGGNFAGIDEGLKNLKAGEVSDLVRTPACFHIFLAEKWRGGAGPSFEEAMPEIREIVFRQKSADVFANWLETAKKRSLIERKIR